MTTQEDLLSPYIESVEKNKGRILFPLIAIIYTIQMVVGILILYVSLRTIGISGATLTSNSLLLVIILAQRIIPLIAFILFLFKTRFGWISITFLSTINVFTYGMQIIQLISLANFANKKTNILIISHSIILLFSVTILILILSKYITQRFSIGNNTKIYVTLGAVVASLIFRFYIADFFMKTPQSHNKTQISTILNGSQIAFYQNTFY